MIQKCDAEDAIEARRPFHAREPRHWGAGDVVAASKMTTRLVASTRMQRRYDLQQHLRRILLKRNLSLKVVHPSRARDGSEYDQLSPSSRVPQIPDSRAALLYFVREKLL
jgi:hypothetical protein